uniref:Uncharacterized protein n=1 Tax=Parascaris equorum TaxID=6256 RepID=A0A914RYP2_PAREQ
MANKIIINKDSSEKVNTNRDAERERDRECERERERERERDPASLSSKNSSFLESIAYNELHNK